MEKKFIMEKEDNIFFAKRKLVDNIMKSAALEDKNISLSGTVNFLNNVNDGEISPSDIMFFKGIKDGWNNVIKNIDDELNMNYISSMYKHILTNNDLDIKFDYTNCDYDKELDEIKNIDDKLLMCIKLFCWIQRSQMFLDGNKRVANLVANKEMIKNGLGIIAVPVDKIGEYTKCLVEFYETNDYTNIINFIYDNCIDGIEN